MTGLSFADAIQLLLVGLSQGCLYSLIAIGLVAVGAAAERTAYDSAEEVEPLQAGAPVPEVTLRTVDDEPLDLAQRVADRGALLVFYRGGW